MTVHSAARAVSRDLGNVLAGVRRLGRIEGTALGFVGGLALAAALSRSNDLVVHGLDASAREALERNPFARPEPVGTTTVLCNYRDPATGRPCTLDTKHLTRWLAHAYDD